MSENFERVQLGAEEEELVTGGRFVWGYYYADSVYHITDPNTGAEYRFNDSYKNNNQKIIDKKKEEKTCGLSTAALAQKWLSQGDIIRIN